MTTPNPASPGGGDPFEDRLAARVRDLSERGVRPIDAAAIARAAGAASARGRRRSWSPAWLLLGAALIGALALSGVSLAGGGPQGVPKTSTDSPGAVTQPTPTPVSGTVAACSAGDLAASVSRWSGAAGSRVADVALRNLGSSACSVLRTSRVELIDGHHHALIAGGTASTGSTVVLQPGASAATEVEVANYCGPDPVAPVSIAFVLPNGDLLVADAVSSGDVSGVPPCNGPSEPGMVAMQPWTPA